MRAAAKWVLWGLALLTVAHGQVADAQSSLRFGKDGGLLVAQFTDLHFGESAEKDDQTLQVGKVGLSVPAPVLVADALDDLMTHVLEAEQPGLAVLSGDMISGFAFPAANLARHVSRLADGTSWYERQWRRLVAPLHAAGLPYASILGNHDGEADLSRRGIADVERLTGRGQSLTLPGPEELPGAGNYWIDVLDPEGEAVAARIWMLDSGNRGCGRLAWGWGCVPSETVAWVRQQAARLPRVPSLAFVHIPLPQHFLAWNHGPVNGSKGELVGCPGMDSGFFELAREIGIDAVYSGHDHNNDFCGSVHGVRLAYGRKSGFGSYGPTGGLQHGVRLIELRMGTSPADSPTWIRQADGSRQEQAAAPQDRPFIQHTCSLDESPCDQALGPRACLTLRRARNSAVLAGTMACVVAAAAAAAVAAVALARFAQRQARSSSGWRRVSSAEKPLWSAGASGAASPV